MVNKQKRLTAATRSLLHFALSSFTLRTHSRIITAPMQTSSIHPSATSGPWIPSEWRQRSAISVRRYQTKRDLLLLLACWQFGPSRRLCFQIALACENMQRVALTASHAHFGNTSI